MTSLPMLTTLGRRLAAPATRPWRRSYTMPTIDRVELSLENSLKETHSIEAELQQSTIDMVPRIDDATHATQDVHGMELVSRLKAYQNQKKKVGHFGSKVSPGFIPDVLVDEPLASADITLEELMAAQAHMGHATGLWNPMNSRWIFGVRQGIHIISLEQTAAHLRRACRVIEGVAEKAGIILFVGTRRGHARAVIAAARRCGGYHLFDKWRPGAITNRMSMLEGLPLQALDPLDRPLEGFSEQLRRFPPVMPDLVVCLNPLENYVLLHECGLATVPTIGIIDTDSDPTWVTYPIPGNDDSVRCAQLVVGALSIAAQTGRTKRLQNARRGEVPYQTVNMRSKKLR